MHKQQYSSCIKVGSGGNLGLSREYSKKIYGPMFYLWILMTPGRLHI